MFFLEIEKCMIFFFFLHCWLYSVNGGVRLGWDPAHEFPVLQQSAACYRRSFPFRWIFKIFPSLCLAVAMPFFSRFAVKRTREDSRCERSCGNNLHQRSNRCCLMKLINIYWNLPACLLAPTLLLPCLRSTALLCFLTHYCHQLVLSVRACVLLWPLIKLVAGGRLRRPTCGLFDSGQNSTL